MSDNSVGNKDAMRFVASTYSDVDSICTPLKSAFGITHFNFRRTYLDGTRSVLTNDPAWLEHYYTCGYSSCSTFERNSSIIHNYVLWKDLYDSGNFGKIFTDAKNHFGIDHGITLIEKHENFVDFYHFAATPTSSANLLGHYLSNMVLLQKFCLYFREKANRLIIDSKSHLTEASTVPLLPPKMEHEFINYTRNICQLSYGSYIVKNNSQRVNFTVRETQCILLLKKACTTSAIAQILHISKRTVETYFEQIRDKLNVSHKGQVISLANNMVICSPDEYNGVLQNPQFLSYDNINHNFDIKKLHLEDFGLDCTITYQEMQCLKLLICGASAKEIANDLGLSYRTVQNYLEHLRIKTGTHNKSELLNILHKNDIDKKLNLVFANM